MAPHDRFQLLDSVPKASVTVLNIAGVHVYLFGVEELTPAQAKDTTVLFHVHGRTRTYRDAEEIAHQLVHEWRQRGSAEKGLVVATFDNRNHGTRAVCASSGSLLGLANECRLMRFPCEERLEKCRVTRIQLTGVAKTGPRVTPSTPKTCSP